MKIDRLLLSALCARVIKGGLRHMMKDDKKLKNNSLSSFHSSSHFTVLYQKRYNRDRKYRFRLQKQIEEEYEKHSRLEEILKKNGTTEALKKVAGE